MTASNTIKQSVLNQVEAQQQQRMPKRSHLPPVNILDNTGCNQLTEAATTLLAMIAQLKQLHESCNLARLQKEIVKEIQSFEKHALRLDLPNNQILVARYIMCSTLDEFILNLPFAHGNNWKMYSLLSLFHQDTAGGEKFFNILEKLVQDPAENLNLLELIYICLSLGFQGKYNVIAKGDQYLRRIRSALFERIRRQHGDINNQLADHRTPGEHPKTPPVQITVFRLFAAGVLLCSSAYLLFSYRLNALSNNVFGQLSGLSVQTQTPIKQVSEQEPRH